jgi:hypothetical protein
MKRVRIVHSPLESKYTVEQKPLFGFRWKYVDHFDYVTTTNTSPHGPHDFAPVALLRAQKKAEILLAKSVVWEKTNYDWYY